MGRSTQRTRGPCLGDNLATESAAKYRGPLAYSLFMARRYASAVYDAVMCSSVCQYGSCHKPLFY